MHVLIVEDHRDTRQALERLLGRRGYDVAAAEDIRSGMDFLRHEHFDAIVSDIALPDGTGYALMYEARRSGVDALGIAVSAWGFPPEVAEPKVTGFDHHLTKPYDCAELLSLL